MSTIETLLSTIEKLHETQERTAVLEEKSRVFALIAKHIDQYAPQSLERKVLFALYQDIRGD